MQDVLDAPRDLDRAGGAGHVGEQQRELVTAEPREQVALRTVVPSRAATSRSSRSP